MGWRRQRLGRGVRLRFRGQGQEDYAGTHKAVSTRLARRRAIRAQRLLPVADGGSLFPCLPKSRPLQSPIRTPTLSSSPLNPILSRLATRRLPRNKPLSAAGRLSSRVAIKSLAGCTLEPGLASARWKGVPRQPDPGQCQAEACRSQSSQTHKALENTSQHLLSDRDGPLDRHARSCTHRQSVQGSRHQEHHLGPLEERPEESTVASYQGMIDLAQFLSATSFPSRLLNPL